MSPNPIRIPRGAARDINGVAGWAMLALALLLGAPIICAYFIDANVDLLPLVLVVVFAAPGLCAIEDGSPAVLARRCVIVYLAATAMALLSLGIHLIPVSLGGREFLGLVVLVGLVWLAQRTHRLGGGPAIAGLAGLGGYLVGFTAFLMQHRDSRVLQWEHVGASTVRVVALYGAIGMATMLLAGWLRWFVTTRRATLSGRQTSPASTSTEATSSLRANPAEARAWADEPVANTAEPAVVGQQAPSSRQPTRAFGPLDALASLIGFRCRLGLVF